MKPEYPHSIPDAFHAVLAVEPDRRHDELIRRFGSDPELVAEVASLLDQARAVEENGPLGDPGDDDLAPGTRVGPYAIEKLLARGGMGPSTSPGGWRTMSSGWR